MSHLRVLLACAVLYPLMKWREQRASRDVRASDVLPVVEPVSRVIPCVFSTEHGSRCGIRVFASCPQEAAAILVAKYLTMESVR